ncbi:ATP-binding protein [Meridianimarinicoccus sp. RP-17]|uniref:ATP-binding protein n=1 Tax=Meridianimarinicoccus zhengii TaxID=2056810 RepID=UPI000DAD57DA|nr:ATP-binding protein [Phycocomes zhengii]
MTEQRALGFDAAAWMQAALAHLAARLHHEVALTRALRGPDRQEGFLGLFLDGGEAERVLAELAGRLRAEAVPDAVRLDAEADALAARRGGFWRHLATACHLGEAELDMLLLAAAPALDPRFGRVYGFLNDDMARRHLTPALAGRLLERHGLDALTLRRMLASDAPLRLFGLVTCEEGLPFVESALRIDENLIERLLGGVAPAGIGVTLLPPSERARDAVPPMALIVAPPGERSDGGALAMDLAAGRGLRVGLVTWCGQDMPALTRALRESRLAGTLPVLRGFDAAPENLRRTLLAGLAAPAAILTARAGDWQSAGFVGALLTAPHQGSAERRARLDALALRHAADGPELRAALYRAEHLSLIDLAEALGRHADAPSLAAALRLQAAEGLAGLAQPVTAGFTLRDLVLPARTRRALETLASWQETAPRVLEDWGLGPRLGKSRSLTALFKGPSGTGKTIAAGAVARALGLPLFRVDLAGMISKYIGETEKNLDRLFAAADQSDVVLFFDEADAVFGQRSEVQDSHDRYANLEVSYLLQRLESFEGVSILATNLAQNIDEAFLRRLDMVVEFPTPDAGHRAALWRRGAGPDVPVAGEIDFDRLAGFELTGGEIRNCWLRAAHRAAATGQPVDMALLLGAVWQELVKQGRPIRRDAFGGYYTGLRADMGAR